MSEITIIHNITHLSFNKSVAWIKYGVPLGIKLMAWLSIKYNEHNRNVNLGKVCAQMYTMKTRANKPTFSKNERKCAATDVTHLKLFGINSTVSEIYAVLILH